MRALLPGGDARIREVDLGDLPDLILVGSVLVDQARDAAFLGGALVNRSVQAGLEGFSAAVPQSTPALEHTFSSALLPYSRLLKASVVP